MLSASPAVPLSAIEFAPDGHGRRLSLTTAHGRQFFTHRDGLPSPEVLTPIGGTPAGSGAATPIGSSSDSDPNSRRGSQNNLDKGYDEGTSLFKADSRGGIWHSADVSVIFSWFLFLLSCRVLFLSCLSLGNSAPTPVCTVQLPCMWSCIWSPLPISKPVRRRSPGSLTLDHGCAEHAHRTHAYELTCGGQMWAGGG